MPVSDARLRATKKYDAKHYRQYSFRLKITDGEKLEAYAAGRGLTVGKLMMELALDTLGKVTEQK